MTETTDIKALREIAFNANMAITRLSANGEECLYAIGEDPQIDKDVELSNQFHKAFNPIVVIYLLDQLEAERQRADNAQTLLMPDGLHENTKALVIGFANAMAAKLYKAEQKYGWSDAWMQSDWQDKCLTDFNHHITKGDPLDVANYCAFMHYHGWSTALKGEQVPVAITDDMAMAFHAATTDSALAQDDMEEIKAGLLAVQELFTAPQKPIVFEARCDDDGTTTSEFDMGWNAYRDAAIEAAGGKVAK